MAEPSLDPDIELERWLARIEGLHPKAMDLGLERVATVAGRLGVLGHLGRVVIVAGTNGKGTVVHLLERLLLAAGLRVGSTLSPHLVRYQERFRINGVETDAASLVAALGHIDAVRGDISLTYFEFSFLVALLLMRDAAVDVSILEVGLGGRLDAANVCDADVAVVTSVALDHQVWLGDTVELIGAEKAAIGRPGRPLVCGEREPPASVRAVENSGVLLRLPGRNFDWDAAHAWRLPGTDSALAVSAPPHVPPANVAVALQVLHELDISLDPAAVAAVFADFAVTARCEYIARNTPVGVSGRAPLLVDVAHNPHAAAWLAREMQRRRPPGRVQLVLAGLRDKDVEQLAALLGAHADGLHLASVPGERGLSAQALDVRLRVGHVDTPPRSLHADVASALVQLDADSGSDDLIVVCGCFAAAAAALQWVDGQ